MHKIAFLSIRIIKYIEKNGQTIWRYYAEGAIMLSDSQLFMFSKESSASNVHFYKIMMIFTLSLLLI